MSKNNLDNESYINDENLEDIDDIETDIDMDLELDNEEQIEKSEEELQNERLDLLYHFNTNKHKQDGKHSLKEDTIFKGKNEKKDEEDFEYTDDNDYNDIVRFFNYESEEYSDSVEKNNLTKDVYDVLDNKTNIDFMQNRRKPNKETFNVYYDLLLNELKFKYTKSELFVELSYYFTDNIFNMYKLLDKDSATDIIKELKNKGYLKNLDNINFI
jgi:hypothetical protein